MSEQRKEVVIKGRCCENCNHGEKGLTEEPCHSCGGENNWEKIEDAAISS